MRHLFSIALLSTVACTASLNDGVEPAPIEEGDVRQNAIVGGANATAGQFAHQVSIQTRWGSHFCGGSLIADGWVLTAAHCVEGETASNVRVKANLVNLNSGGQTFNVAEIIQHAGYNDNTMSNDIALLRLSSSTAGLTHVALATNAADASISAPGDIATVSGWGALSENGGSPNQLQFVDVPLLTNGSCNISYNGGIDGTMVCAGYPGGGADSCQGDSGGPMVVDDGGTWVQNGVVSWGHGCARPGKPGVYARVSQFQSWISQRVPNAVFTNGGGTNPNPTPGPGPTPTPTTNVIDVNGSTVIDSVLDAGETETYEIRVPVGQTLTIYSTGSTDTYGTFSGGSVSVQDDDGGEGRNFLVTPAVTAGVYTLQVRGYSGSVTGPYQLHVEGLEDDNAPTPAPTPAPVEFLQEFDLAGARGSNQYFTLEVPAGANIVEFVTTGGTGDADIFVQHGQRPTASSYICRPYVSGNEETCTISAPAAGTYHVMLNGYSAYTGVMLSGTYQ